MAPANHESLPTSKSEDAKAARLKEWEEAFANEAGCSVSHSHPEAVQVADAPEYVKDFIAHEAMKYLDDELKYI